MPYSTLHGMSDADARAIVVYLRSVEPVKNVVPTRQPLPVVLDRPAPSVPDAAIPHTTLPPTDANYAHAEHGRYLATQAGLCLSCHTRWRLGAEQPLELASAFAGGRTFSAKEWIVPPPAPPVIYSYNITPHASGIAGWTAEQVAQTIVHGVDAQGHVPCRPMPSGPGGALGGVTDDDALDIGWYITTLPPIPSDDIPQCVR
jgi:hypothetical protein